MGHRTSKNSAKEKWLSPVEILPELFEDVAVSEIFSDPKFWADAYYKSDPAIILGAYEEIKPKTKDELKSFVKNHFVVPVLNEIETSGRHEQDQSIEEYIFSMWSELSRDADKDVSDLTLLPLERKYIVPGGRFREVYYWDSFFTMIGMQETHPEMVRNTVRNFADQISLYGFIPNGNRSYYLSRSQPPFFFQMVGLLDLENPARAYSRYLTELKREYLFWSDAGLEEPRYRIQLDGNVWLNRYCDSKCVPRDECYLYDLETANSAENKEQVYRDLRSGAESGWDYSSRWLFDGENLDTICTTSILPICLNSILYGMERAIAAGCQEQGDLGTSELYETKANIRRNAMDKYMWDDGAGFYRDYNFENGRQTNTISAAMVYPLYFGCASEEQASRVADALELLLLAKGGLNTTSVNIGQQWDSPNGWAPLQYLAVEGLKAYGHDSLAVEIRERWLKTVSRVFDKTGHMFEKYDVVNGLRGGGGEYEVQPGFGWTNGVHLSFLKDRK